MGDHRATIKMQIDFHGIHKECDMWINWNHWDESSVTGWLQTVHREGMAAYDQMVYESQRKERETRERKEELAELKRLKEKYEPFPLKTLEKAVDAARTTPRNEGEQDEQSL